MTIPLDTIGSYITLITAIFSALLAGLWFSLVLWAFRDMRLRSRDPFAQLLAFVLVAAIPFFGIILYLILRPPETLAERYERALEEEALLQEIEERPRCPKCSRVIEDDWAICPACHTALKKQCPTCYSLIELSWMRCPLCTAEQPAEPPAFRPSILAQLLPHMQKGSANSGTFQIQRPTTYQPTQISPARAASLPAVAPERTADRTPDPITGSVKTSRPDVDMTDDPTVPMAPITDNLDSDTQSSS